MNSSRRKLRGVLPVFQTPYHADETIDLATLEMEVAWLYDRGADGIVMAMVSEVLRLSSSEREELAEAACKFGSSRGVVVISVGAESSKIAEGYAKHAETAGADAVMAIPPVSVILGEAELVAYYARILHAVSIPVIVQDASGYVGRPMSIAMQARLLDEFGPERVLFKPEASPIVPRLVELLHATDGRARVFDGTGGNALVESHQHGVVGTMPGADVIRALVALWRALEVGDAAKARRIHEPLAALISIQTSLEVARRRSICFATGHIQEYDCPAVGFRLNEETQREVDRLFGRLMAACLTLHTSMG